jgi:eukaryotic-like serine/threonine-protein kinase
VTTVDVASQPEDQRPSSCEHGAPQRHGALASLCPGCLMQLALEPPALPRSTEGDGTAGLTPECIGDHEIIGELGHGGMGVVYRARHRATGCVVALKMIRAGQLPTPEARRRFRAEIEAAAALDHPHIVRIDEVGEHEGLPFFTMRLCAGSLDKELQRYHDPAKAAALIATVARAVHHAHERGVLHRDLKPANILLDEAGRPHVSDFGAAKRIGEPGQTGQALRTEVRTETGMLIGTPPYMAPERIHGDARSVTIAVDVYSLGVVLYQLITGELPFKGEGQAGTGVMRDTEPARPRALVPKVPRDLETICLQCLAQDPARRYRSAEALADDLDRFQERKPIEARPASLAGRAWRFARRHPFAVGVILLLAAVAAAAVSVARAQERELQRDGLRTNAYAAHALAGAVAFHLREQIDVAVATASDPSVARMLHGGDHEALEQRRVETPFEDISLFDRSGTLLVYAPWPPRARSGNYAWRDYFRGARRLGEAGYRAGYISRVIRAEADDRYKFGISAPIYDGGAWIGVLLATIGNDFALKRRRLDHASDGGPMAVIVAPRDRSRYSTEGAGDYVAILHEGLTHGTVVPIDSPRLRELGVTHTEPKQLRWIDPEPITDDAYHDPVPGYEGRWLAGFAPVGDTGFVVIVQTRYDAAVQPNARLWRIAQVGGVILMVAVIGLGLSGFARRRRRRRVPATTSR